MTDSVIHCNAVSPGFFAVLGAPIVNGRDFSERDAHDSPEGFRSAIVNESFAKRYFGERNPLGARLGLGNRPDTRVDIEIVGVVKTFHYRGLRRAEEQAFFPLFEENRFGGGTFYVRTRVRSPSAFLSIRAAIRQLDPALPITLRTVNDQLDRVLVTERMLATLASAFAALAILLA